MTADVEKPQKLSGAPPYYPAEAREAGVGGTVILRAMIDEGGNVSGVEVLAGQPKGLSEEAVKAVETWKFNPARHGQLRARSRWTGGGSKPWSTSTTS